MTEFNYTPSGNTQVKPQVVNVNQASTTSRTLDAISKAVGTVGQAYVQKAQTDKKDNYIQASTEANSVRYAYSQQLASTENPAEKAQYFENYKLALTSLEEGYELDDNYSLMLQNSNQAHINSQEIVINTELKQYRTDLLNEGTMQGLIAMSGSSKEDITHFLQDNKEGYLSLGHEEKDINTMMLASVVSSKQATLSTATSYSQVKAIKQDVKDITKLLDPKLVGKDVYNKAINDILQAEKVMSDNEFKNLSLAKSSGKKDIFYKQLDKVDALGLIDTERKALEKASFKQAKAQANTDAIKMYENSDEYRYFQSTPAEYKEQMRLFGYKDDFKIIKYNEEYKAYNAYNPSTTPLSFVGEKHHELGIRKAKVTIENSIRNKDIFTAMEVSAKSGQVQQLKDLTTSIMSNDNPTTMAKQLPVLIGMYNQDKALVVNKFMNPEQRASFHYMRYVLQNKGTISEGDILRMADVKSSKAKILIPRKPFNEAFEGDPDLITKRDTYDALYRYIGDADKVVEFMKEDKEASTVGVIDVGTSGKRGYSDDQIEKAFKPVIDTFEQLFTGTDISLKHHKETDTMWLYSNGYPQQDLRLDYKLYMDASNIQNRIDMEGSAWETAKANLFLRIDDTLQPTQDRISNFSFRANPERVQELKNIFSPEYWYGKLYKGE